MIRVQPPPEPPRFDVQCRQRGHAWLATRTDETAEFPNYWRHFLAPLREGFHGRCGYTALWDRNGTVDHFLSQSGNPGLVYEWENYRYASGWLNSSKNKRELDGRILDPYQVRDDWFEILLPTLEMRLTSCVPTRMRGRAEFTLDRLQLRDGDRVYDQRKTYLEMFKSGELSLAGLDRMAPVLATAVRRHQLLDHLKLHPTVSRAEVADVCALAPGRTGYFLSTWRKAGHLVAQGRGRNVRYRRA